MFFRDTTDGKKIHFSKDGVINWYNRGPTIYNRSHLDHARTFGLIDNMRRYLLMQGHNIRFGFNITDIDDKIAKRVREITILSDGDDINVICKQFIKDMERFFWEDCDSLHP